MGLALAAWAWAAVARPWGAATWLGLAAASVGWMFVASPAQPAASRARHVAWLAVVPALAWTAMIVLFWPGILSPDSIDQLLQAQARDFTEWQPVGHTLMLVPSEWLFLPPAVFLMAQVAVAAGVVAVAFGQQARAGIPRWGLVISALALAVSPPLLFMFATLWRDVTYGVCLVGAGVCLVASPEQRWRLPALGLLLFGAMLARLNGPLVVGLCLGLAAVTGVLRLRQVVALGAAVYAALFVLKGPVYTAWGVDRKAPDFVVAAHQIAAHLDAGTPLQRQEVAMLDRISAVQGGWRYTCWSAFPTALVPAFDLEEARGHRRELMRLALVLAWRDPAVTTRHVACLSRIAWAFEYTDAWLYRTEARLTPHGLHYVVDNRVLGVTEQSPRPELARRVVRAQASQPTFVWAPGTYLFLIAFALAPVVGRVGLPWRHLAWSLPLLAHAVTLAILNIAFESRYGVPVMFGALLWAPGLIALAVDTRFALVGGRIRGQS